MPSRKIIVNADDLGLCASVNTAIFDVFRAGNLSSATLMVNMPGTEDAVTRAREHPGLGIGLHFCITEGIALSGPSSLTAADGSFLGRSELAGRVYQGKVSAADVRRELEAQLGHMRQLGVRPTHVDSHQHVHMMPRVFAAMVPVLREAALPARMVDPPRGAVLASMRRPKKAMKQWLNMRFASKNRALFGGRTNDALVSIHDLESHGPYDAATYNTLLEPTRPDELVEVMVHPYILGKDVLDMYTAHMTAKRPFLERCAAEYAALSGARVFGEAELVTYAEA